MRRLNLVLLATLQLCGAKPSPFNIHEDILAYPQFEVVFSEGSISEKEAEALLEQNARSPTYSADFSQPTYGEGHTSGDRLPRNDQADKTYEIMNMSPLKYLCSIPVVEPSSLENSTETELAKAEQAREFDRAATSGWDLLHPLTEGCLYYGYGWWSYSLCKNREIVQYHALPSVPNGQPPKRDPQTAQFVLGKVPTLPAKAYERERAHQDDEKQVPAELAVKGDQRYLVQRLEGGTVCDLTGRERTVEVQYHCVPGMKHDRIGWIKEVTICSYLMVVNTGRLCNDVAFLPPEQIEANPINCQLISEGGGEDLAAVESGALVHQDSARFGEGSATSDTAWWKDKDVSVGGIIVGARHMLSKADEDGKPPAKLGPPRSQLGDSYDYLSSKLKKIQQGKDVQAKDKETPAQRRGNGQAQDQERDTAADVEANVGSILQKLKDAFIPSTPESTSQTIAEGKSKAEGGKAWILSDKQLKELGLSPDVVKEMRDQIAKLAGGQGWKLEIVDMGDGEARELRGWVDEPEEGFQDEEQGSEEKFKDEL